MLRTTDALTDYDRELIAWLRNREPIKTILANLGKGRDPFCPEELDDTARVLTACALVFDNDHHPVTIALLLADLPAGFGCWLELIRDAIDAAPFEDQAFKENFRGAFFMAQTLIYMLHREKHKYA